MSPKNLRKLVVCLALSVVAALVLFSLSVAVAGSPAGPGEDLYKAKCAMCHGPDGGGSTPMGKKENVRDLRLPEVQKQSDAQLTQIIAKGKNKMLSYEGKLTAEQITQLVAVIRELGKKK